MIKQNSTGYSSRLLLLFTIALIAISFFTWGVYSTLNRSFPFNLLSHIKHRITEATQPSHATIVMIGDSITAQADWQNLFPGVSILNRGIGGNQTEDVIKRLDSILATKPTTAFLMIGINDITHGIPHEKILANYIEIIKTLKSNKVTPVIQSTLYVANDFPEAFHLQDYLASHSHESELINIEVKKLNDDLSDYANKNGLVFININEVLSKKSSSETLNCAITSDGLHLNSDGQQVWKNVLAKYVKH